MARYNVRDLLGHWVKPRSKRGQMCPHACCRNKRVHPANFPVILPRELLRRATDRELLQHYQQHKVANNDRARRQIEREIDRREDAARRRAAAAERSRDRRSARASDREAAYHARFLAAESATNGYMVNARGRQLGHTERSLLTNRRNAERYGTDELLEHLGMERRGRMERRR